MRARVGGITMKRFLSLEDREFTVPALVEALTLKAG